MYNQYKQFKEQMEDEDANLTEKQQIALQNYSRYDETFV